MKMDVNDEGDNILLYKSLSYVAKHSASVDTLSTHCKNVFSFSFGASITRSWDLS